MLKDFQVEFHKKCGKQLITKWYFYHILYRQWSTDHDHYSMCSAPFMLVKHYKISKKFFFLRLVAIYSTRLSISGIFSVSRHNLNECAISNNTNPDNKHLILISANHEFVYKLCKMKSLSYAFQDYFCLVSHSVSTACIGCEYDSKYKIRKHKWCVQFVSNIDICFSRFILIGMEPLPMHFNLTHVWACSALRQHWK